MCAKVGRSRSVPSQDCFAQCNFFPLKPRCPFLMEKTFIRKFFIEEKNVQSKIAFKNWGKVFLSLMCIFQLFFGAAKLIKIFNNTVFCLFKKLGFMKRVRGSTFVCGPFPACSMNLILDQPTRSLSLNSRNQNCRQDLNSIHLS